MIVVAVLFAPGGISSILIVVDPINVSLNSLESYLTLKMDLQLLHLNYEIGF